jgi:two-component system LytT family response regulator
MIKVIIIDDEQHCIDTMQSELEKTNQEIQIVATYNSATEAIKILPALSFDILFLDIEMPKLNGFEFLKLLPTYNFTVIFTTAYSQYAITAFKYAAFDFLLKPIHATDIESCLERWQHSFKLRSNVQQINYLKEIIDDKTKPYRITITTKNGYHFINIADIIYCESDSNYTIFHLHEDRKIIASKTLKEFEQLLLQHQFIRIHKSYLVNQQKINKLNKGINYTIQMNNGNEIPVARNKQEILRNSIL